VQLLFANAHMNIYIIFKKKRGTSSWNCNLDGARNLRSGSHQECPLEVAFRSARAAFAGTCLHPGGSDHAHVKAGCVWVAFDGLQAGLNLLKTIWVRGVHHHMRGVVVQRRGDLRKARLTSITEKMKGVR
jgi:hypothetical protein